MTEETEETIGPRFQPEDGTKPEDLPTFSLNLVDLCNGIDCVSGGQFPAEAVVGMAAHIIMGHTPAGDDHGPVFSITAVKVVEPVQPVAPAMSEPGGSRPN